MHMADALVSATVAGTMYALSAGVPVKYCARNSVLNALRAKTLFLMNKSLTG